MLRAREQFVCRDVVEMLTDYVEGALSRRDRRRLEAHLAACDACSEYLLQLRTTIELTGTLSDDDLTPEMRKEFSALYRRWRAGSG
jgi:anti-sigma factor RsiW